MQAELLALHQQLTCEHAVLGHLHACSHRERLCRIHLVHARFFSDSKFLGRKDAGPRLRILGGVTAAFGEGCVCFSDEFGQFVESLLILRLRQVEDGFCILYISIAVTLRGVSEKSGHRVEVLLGDGIKLVIVTGRTVCREAQPDPGRRGHPVIGIHGQVFLGDGAALGRGDVAAMKSRGDQLLTCGLRQQISRDLLQGEGIKAHVPIEGTHHPVAVGPHLAIRVVVDAMGVAVACGIQPVAASMLTPLLRVHEPLHQLFISIR